ncbi:MAG: ATP-binding cassette domain-containing protein, partial [Coriobacteriaceae bacterium]|nr:ATP-binding cassette domain-containing protein [Coriobacteriaceae bacterium]
MLLFDHVSYSYPARHTPAVCDVSLALEPGCRIALLGANGSGKSTLARLANALLLPDEGCVVADGLSTTSQQTIRELRKLVGLVLQDPDNQIISSSVLDDVAFGPENLGLDRAEIARRCKEALALVGLTGYESRDPNMLSGGEKQRLVIAGILAMEPRYLVLDEPTSMLDVTGRNEVRAAIDALHDKGHGILHITHDLEEALEADLVVVLKQGRVVFSGTAEELMRDVKALADYGIGLTPLLQLQSLLSQPRTFAIRAKSEADLKMNEPSPGAQSALGDADELLPAGASTVPMADEPLPETGEILALENVSFTYTQAGLTQHQALADVSMTVRPGSYLLVLGHTGSGKSTLLRIGAGLLKPDGGKATLIRRADPTNIMAGAIPIEDNINRAVSEAVGIVIKPGVVGLVFQQPETQLFAQTVAEDICFGPRNLGMLSDARQRDTVARESLAAVGLDYQEFAERSPFTLSGG